ncbi:universal stress protein [Desulfobacterales bacterium HSG16]|nr:universal stress protein [Desulfobacterales bacterium HSG16]
MIIPKIKIKKILYATDLSENARFAFAYAASLANMYNAKLVILHTLDEIPNIDRTVIGYISTEQWEEIKQRNIEETRESLLGKRRSNTAIREVLDKFNENAQATNENASFETDEVLVVYGIPVEQIIKQADEKDCDLIVMGTHGHGVLAGTMMGSTAQRVMRRSKKPVMVIRLPDNE